MKYCNNKEEEVFTIHTPGERSELMFRRLYMCDLMRKKIEFDSSKISLISPMNEPYWKVSDLRKQCEQNNIKIYNSAYDEHDWCNVKKLKYIYDSLTQINTDYCLIMDGADAWLCTNYYGDNLIEKFNKFNSSIVYNGDPFQFPLLNIEGPDYEKKYTQINKYLNAGVCFGKTQELLELYKEAYIFGDTLKFNRDEQFVLRELLVNSNEQRFTVDRNNDLFILYHEQANQFTRKVDKLILTE